MTNAPTTLAVDGITYVRSDSIPNPADEDTFEEGFFGYAVNDGTNNLIIGKSDVDEDGVAVFIKDGFSVRYGLTGLYDVFQNGFVGIIPVRNITINPSQIIFSVKLTDKEAASVRGALDARNSQRYP